MSCLGFKIFQPVVAYKPLLIKHKKCLIQWYLNNNYQLLNEGVSHYSLLLEAKYVIFFSFLPIFVMFFFFFCKSLLDYCSLISIRGGTIYSKLGARLTLQPKKSGCAKSAVSLLKAQKVPAQMHTLRIRLYRPWSFVDFCQ